MGDKQRLPRGAVLAILAVAALLYALGAWTVLAVRTGQESVIPFVTSQGGPAPKAPVGGQASAPASSPPTVPTPPSQPPTPSSVPPSPAATTGVATATVAASGAATPSAGLTVLPTAPSPRETALGNFKVEVQGTELVTTLEKVAPRREGGMFVFVSLLVSNGEKTRRLFGGGGAEFPGVPAEEQIGVVLRDNTGYESPAFATVPQPEAQRKWNPLPQTIDPLSQKQLTLAFDVPGDTGPFQLVLRAFPSREEQRISLEVPRASAGGTATLSAPTAISSATVAPTIALTLTATAALPTPSPSPTATQAPSGPLLTGIGAPTPGPKGPVLTAPPGPTPSR